MKIKDIKLKDVERRAVYYYTNDKNTEIEEIKLKNTINENSGYFLITGKIKTTDGTVYPAVLGISSVDSGELFEGYFFVNGKWVSQNDKDFIKKIRKTKSQVFPYKYHLNVKVEGDIHTSHQY